MMSSQYNKFGRLPTMPETWRRTYMNNDNASSTSVQQELMQIAEGRQDEEVMQVQEGQEQEEEGQHSSTKKRQRGDTDNAEIGRIGDEIEKAYKELIDQGVEEEVANAQSLIKATGRNTRLRHEPNSKTTGQKGTKRAPQSSTQQKQIEELKEKLEGEQKKLEAERNERLAQEKKHQDLALQFQLLYSHLLDKGLAPTNLAMPSPTHEVNTSSRASNDQTENN